MTWISVKDKKPKLGIRYRYLFVNGKKDVTFGYAYDWDLENDEYLWINDMDNETNEIARYWMTLPELPNEMG